MDNRPFHNHGSFNGFCSAEKHLALIGGLNPHKEGYRKTDSGFVLTNPLVAFFVMFHYFVDNVRFTDTGAVCACCKKFVYKIG